MPGRPKKPHIARIAHIAYVGRVAYTRLTESPESLTETAPPVSVGNPNPKSKKPSAYLTETFSLSAAEVVAELGVSRRTLSRILASRKLTYLKLDGLLRFRPSDVDRFKEKRTYRAI